jgi:ABC-type glycerol-3-phosphate transport system permease component
MRAQTVRAIGVHVLLCIAHALALFPLSWMVMASFMQAREASGYPPRWLPSEPSLDQYRTLFSRLDARGDTRCHEAGAYRATRHRSLRGAAGLLHHPRDHLGGIKGCRTRI